MDVSNRDEEAPLIHRYGIPAAVPDTRKPYQKLLAVYFILASILFERIAFYSIASGISFTLQSNKTFNWSSEHSSTAMYIFSGTSYIWTLIFAIISDAKLGRAATIIIGFLLYLIGYSFITIIATEPTWLCPNTTISYNPITIGDEWCAPITLGTLVIIAIGAGAVKSNMVVFGAEQIQQSRLTSRYFDKYVVAVNIGAMIEIWVVPKIQGDPMYNSIAYIAYLIASSTLVIAALLFLIGWRYYIHVKSYETVVAKCIPVIVNAFQTRSHYDKDEDSIEKENANSSRSTLLNASNSLTEEEKSIRISERPSSLLDFAKAANGGKFQDRIVDDVKSLRGALVVFSLLIPYWLIYNQINATFPLQGQHMNGTQGKPYIISWMSLGDPVVVIIGILIFNIFVYKYLRVWNGAVIITTKFVVGMFFAVLSMCVAGIVEYFRQEQCEQDSLDSKLSIYFQLPQNILIGLSQLFAMVASCEFAYFAAPLSAQSLFMSLHFCSAGIASFIGVAYMAIFSLISSNFDQNYIHNNAKSLFECPPAKQVYWSFYTYFFVLAGLQLVFISVFIVCQKKFRFIKLNPQKIETNQFLRHQSISSTGRQ